MCFASRHIFLHATRHTFSRALHHNSSVCAHKKLCRSRGTTRAPTCTKLCGGQLAQNCALDPTTPSIIAITKSRDKISLKQTALSAHKHCAQITSQQTAVILADIVHRSHHSMLHISRHTHNPCDVSPACANRGGSAALAHTTLKSRDLTKNRRVVHKSTLLVE